MGASSPDRPVRSLVAAGVVVWEVAGGTAGGMSGGVDVADRVPHVAAGAEFPVELSREIVQVCHRSQLKGLSLLVEGPDPAGGVAFAVIPFPGELDVPDHPGGGVHEI